MRFLTDENVATSVMLALRQAGHNVLDVKEQQWYGASDQQLIELAVKDKRIIITHDKDFVLQHTVTVVLLRFSNQHPNNVQRNLLDYLESKFLSKALKRKTLIVLSERTFEVHELSK